MKRNTKCIFLIIIVLDVLKVDCQVYGVPQTPCPGVFVYQSDGNTVFGHITLKSSGDPVSTVNLRANFTLAVQLTSTYIGQIEVIGNDPLQKFNSGYPLHYRVHFPVVSPLPRLTSIVVNGQSLCYGQGDVPEPHKYITILSLDHMLFLKRGPINQAYNPYGNSESNLVFEQLGDLHFGDNTQYFTINDIGNREGFWDSGNNKPARPTQPAYEKPSQPNRPPPEYTQTKPRPDYIEYYPELHHNTQATRPPPPPKPVPPPRPLPPSTTAAPTLAAPSETAQRLPAAASVECGVIAGGNERVPLIFNGNTYTRGEWPWLVAIYKRQEGSLTFICAGTLVSERHIVTAAHCMHQKSKISTIKDIVVKIGVYNLEDWGDDISITRTLQTAHIHKSYNATTLENDILVFTMERTVEFNNYIRPACLWNGNTDLSRIVGASGVVAGWGQSEIGPVGKGEPRVVRIPVVSTSTCRASKPEFHKLTSSNTLCAGDRKGSGPCLGDSGGGLYILDNGRWRLRGIVSLSLRPSNGDTTCNLNEYIVFTDTAQYLAWVKKVISTNLFDF